MIRRVIVLTFSDIRLTPGVSGVDFFLRKLFLPRRQASNPASREELAVMPAIRNPKAKGAQPAQSVNVNFPT